MPRRAQQTCLGQPAWKPAMTPFLPVCACTILGRRTGWSGRRVSNSRPQAWEAGALPTELLPLAHRIIVNFCLLDSAPLRLLTPVHQSQAKEKIAFAAH